MAVQQAVKSETAGNAKAAAQAEAGEGSTFCIVDLGNQSRKKVKKLKRGEGKLMEKIESIVEDLNAESVVPEGAPTVVVIVKQKTGLGKIFDDD
jgi:hypothetical protein